MTPSEYVENWLRCLQSFGIEQFPNVSRFDKVAGLTGGQVNETTEAIVTCMVEKSTALNKGDRSIGNLLGVDEVSRYSTDSIVERRLFPIMTYPSGVVLMVSMEPGRGFSCRWMDPKYYYFEEMGLDYFLSDWCGTPWLVVERIMKRGRSYWNQIQIQAWADCF